MARRLLPSFFSEIRVVHFKRRDSFRADLEVKQNSLRQRTLPLPWKIPLNLPRPCPPASALVSALSSLLQSLSTWKPAFCSHPPSGTRPSRVLGVDGPQLAPHPRTHGCGAGGKPVFSALGTCAHPPPAGRPPGGWAGDPRGALPTVHSRRRGDPLRDWTETQKGKG